MKNEAKNSFAASSDISIKKRWNKKAGDYKIGHP